MVMVIIKTGKYRSKAPETSSKRSWEPKIYSVLYLVFNSATNMMKICKLIQI